MKYAIKNWSEFQHYKDRNPPWIKLHFALLSSADWVALDDASRALAIACMLLASRSDGQIDGSKAGLAYIHRVAYLNSQPNLKPLIECGFLVPLSDASTMHADARPETETETETETDKAQTDSVESSAPLFMELPTNNGKRYPITEGLVSEWGELYPAVDVRQEIRKAKGWLDSNPAKRKTYGGMKRFVNGWLSRCQDRGGSNGNASQAGSDYGKGAI